MKYFAKLWLFFFALASGVTYFFSNEVESHTLSRTLQFGFDAFGRSCILLTLDAAFRSLIVVLPISFFCLFFALFISFLVSTKNPTLQLFWNTLTDTLSSLPGFLIALSLSVLFGDQFFTVLLAALLLVLPYLVRFFESQIIHLQASEYVSSANALGANRAHIFLKHILPELARSLLAILPFLMTRLLVIETSLSFLGLNTSAGETWGKLLFQGKDYLLEAPWISIFCGAPLFLTLFSFHLLSRHEQN